MNLRLLMLLAVLLLGVATPQAAAAAASPEPSPSPSVAGSRTLLPPFEYPGGQPIPRPRTRQDRIISTIAPIAMVVVLIAGLYVYWLIRKGI